MARTHIEGSFQVRGDKLSLLAQVSGKQGVSIDTSRSGMLVAAAQVIAELKGGL